MGLFSRLKKACKVERVPEPQPCVLLKHTTITAENHMHPHPLDEISGGAHEIVDRKNEAGRRERKNKRFWRSFLIFFRRRTGKYDLAKSEKVYQSEAGSYKRLTDGKITYDVRDF